MLVYQRVYPNRSAKSGDLCCCQHAWTSAQPQKWVAWLKFSLYSLKGEKNLSGNHGLKLSTKLSRKTVYLMRPNGYWCQAATWLSNQFTFSRLESGLAWQLCTSCLRLSSPFVSKWLKSPDLFLSLPDVQRLQSFIHVSKSKSESKSCDVLTCSLRASKNPQGEVVSGQHQWRPGFTMNLMQKMARSCKIHEFEGWESISIHIRIWRMLCISSISSPSRQRQKKLHHGVLLAGLGSTEFTQDSWFRRRKISDRLMGQWYRWTFPEIGFLISWWFGTVFFLCSFMFLPFHVAGACSFLFIKTHEDWWIWSSINITNVQPSRWFNVRVMRYVFSDWEMRLKQIHVLCCKGLFEIQGSHGYPKI